MESSKSFKCLCGKEYLQYQSLWRHHKTCEVYLNNSNICSNVNKNIGLYDKNTDWKQSHKIVQELKEQNNKLVQENKVLQEQIKSFNEQKILQDQLKTLYEQNQKILQYQIIQLQEQLLIKSTEQTKVITENKEEPKEKEEKPEVQQNKKAHVKAYLASCNPITYTEFMNNYIPTADDYSNILKTGLLNGTVTNIMNYLSKYEKRCYPFVISNNQNIRLRLHIFDNNEWKVVIGYEAVKILEKMVQRFINKLYSHLNSVFKPAYPGIDDINHKDHITHSQYRYAMGNALGNSDDKIDKITNTVKQYFCIIEVDDEESDTN
jgi:hypothetical protein